LAFLKVNESGVYMTDFLSDLSESMPTSGADSAASISSDNPSRRPLHLLMLGDRDDIVSTIKALHQCGFSEAKSWSKIIPCPNATETLTQLQLTPLSDRWISILTRHFS
jgi:hypothetical protein